MVLDLGFLGDTFHLLSALWMVRQAYPQAALHCAMAGVRGRIEFDAIGRGDSTHALMTSAPAVLWFRPNPGSEVWIPSGGKFRTIFGTGDDPHAALHGIETAKLIAAVQAVFAAAETLKT